MKESKYACVGILSMVVALSLSSCSTSTYTVKNRPESFTYSPTSDGRKDTSYSYSEADKGEQKGEKKKEKEEKTPENLQDILTERYSTFTPAECLKGIEPESCLDVIIREAEKRGDIKKVSSHLIFNEVSSAQNMDISVIAAIRKKQIKRISINYNIDRNNSPFTLLLCKLSDRLDFTVDFGTQVTSAKGLFEYCKISVFPKINTSGITDMGYMFANAVITGNMPEYDMSSVTDMNHMFHEAKINGKLSFTDTSRVTSTEYMFAGSKINTRLPLFNTSAVKSMKGMFTGAEFRENEFQENNRNDYTIPFFDTAKVENMSAMFKSSNVTAVPPFNTSNVTDMSEMFSRTGRLRQIPVFDTAKVTNMDYLVSESSVESVPDLNRSSLERDPDNQCTNIKTILYKAKKLDNETKEQWKEEYTCAEKWQESYEKFHKEEDKRNNRNSDMDGVSILCFLALPVCATSISTEDENPFNFLTAPAAGKP